MKLFLDVLPPPVDQWNNVGIRTTENLTLYRLGRTLFKNVHFLFPFSTATRVHDGIFPASQASVYEFSSSVGPRPVPCQLTCAADLQHERVEQVSCTPTEKQRTKNQLLRLRCFFSWTHVQWRSEPGSASEGCCDSVWRSMSNLTERTSDCMSP